uniref:Ribonuclease P n=1 Tax=Ditylenchus dipsaci TaxID=166011 RepID=A0A915EEY3_9BILA
MFGALNKRELLKVVNVPTINSTEIVPSLGQTTFCAKKNSLDSKKSFSGPKLPIKMNLHRLAYSDINPTKKKYCCPCLVCRQNYFNTTSSPDDMPRIESFFVDADLDEEEGEADPEAAIRLENAQGKIYRELDDNTSFDETYYKEVLQENDMSADDLLDQLITKHDSFDRQKAIYCLNDLLQIANHNLAAENPALLAIGIKMLALIHAQGNPLGTESSLEISNKIIAYFQRNLDQIADAQEKAVLKLFLGACQGEIFLDGQILSESRMWDASDCFHILAAIAIRTGKLEELKKLSLEMARGQNTSVKESSVKSKSTVEKKEGLVKDMQSESDLEKAQLLTIFMEQLRIQEEAVTQGEYAVFIKPALKQYPAWRVFTTKQMPDHTCELCYEATKATEAARHTSLPSPQLLTTKQHLLLKKKIKTFLTDQAGEKVKQFKAQYKKLEMELKEMKAGSFHDRKEGHRPLIVDGMNILNIDKSKTNRKYLVEQERIGQWNFKSMFKFVLATMAADYSPALVIFKQGQVDEKQIASLGFVGIKYFIHDGSSDADLFVLNAALMYGPETHVFANDSYLETHSDGELVKSLDKSTVKLLETFCKTNQIKFSKKLKTYELPCNYAAPILKDDYGYHICLSRNFRHMRWSDNPGGIKCIRTAHLPGNAKERSKKRREARQKLLKQKETAARKLIQDGQKGKEEE